MDITQTIALTMGVAWASGINLYATILVLGYMGMTGNIDLPPDLEILADPMVMVAAGLMYAIEFFADKVPGVDTGWDTLHTFIRIPAGAVLAAGAVGEVGTGAQLAAGLVGGTLATGSHATKAGSRVLINTSPEPVSNWFASVGEDVVEFSTTSLDLRGRGGGDRPVDRQVDHDSVASGPAASEPTGSPGATREGTALGSTTSGPAPRV